MAAAHPQVGAQPRQCCASGAHEAFALALGPGEHVLHRLALEQAHDHLGLHALRVDLMAIFGGAGAAATDST